MIGKKGVRRGGVIGFVSGEGELINGKEKELQQYLNHSRKKNSKSHGAIAFSIASFLTRENS